jgi:tetratricopeptide (TPR) repeat protein
MKHILTALFLFTVAGSLLMAQQQPQRLLRVSPFASVSQTIGISEVTVTFHRPGVKGREIWGKLVPFGQVWRAGANNATVFSFSDDVQINGTMLKAGKYSFFTIPGEKEWTVIFNSNADQWGAYYYDSTKNVLTFTVTPEQASHEEWLSYSFSDLTMSSAKVFLRWEKLSLSFTVATNTNENIAKLESSLTTQAATQAALLARYSIDNKSDYERGMQAADRAIALAPTWSNYSLKAQLLAAQDKFADAVKAGEQAIEIGKKAGANTSFFEKMVGEWKAKLPATKGKKK